MDKKRLRGLAQIVISAVLLFFILRTVQWQDVRTALLSIDLRWLAAAWALFMLGVVVRAGRWQVLLRALGVPRRLGELTNWYFVGSFFNVILPTGFGGDAIRVAELGADTRRVGPVLNSVLVDRYMGIMVLLPMGLIAGLAQPGTARTGVMALMAVLFGGGLLVAWLLRRPWWTAWASRPGTWGRIVRELRLSSLAEAVQPYDRPTMVRALVVSLIFNFLQIGWNMAIAQGLGLRLPLATFLTLVPLTAVALLLPSFGGLGVRELSYVGLFGQVGVVRPTAIALSLGVYIITVATGLVGGALYVLQGIRRASVASAAAGQAPEQGLNTKKV
ncbi:MAG TPA: lysylphosphatidylglycerol synthase transmembrane domain-containing protein [Anaerolineae bacterium]